MGLLALALSVNPPPSAPDGRHVVIVHYADRAALERVASQPVAVRPVTPEGPTYYVYLPLIIK